MKKIKNYGSYISKKDYVGFLCGVLIFVLDFLQKFFILRLDFEIFLEFHNCGYKVAHMHYYFSL